MHAPQSGTWRESHVPPTSRASRLSSCLRKGKLLCETPAAHVRGIHHHHTVVTTVINKRVATHKSVDESVKLLPAAVPPPRTAIMIEQLPSLKFSDLLYPTADTIERLRHICATCGFFTISSHPVPRTLLDNARNASVSFFELPCEVKDRYAHDKQLVTPSTCRGYNRHEMLNKEDDDGGKECFDLGVEKQHITAGVPFSGPTVLPTEEDVPNFKSSLLELQQVVLGSLVPVVSRALALALGKQSDFFDQCLRDLTLIQRVIYYPRDATAGRHTDNGLFTLLFHDETKQGEEASLKVYTGGKWIDVPGRKGELVVNLGDMFQLWTNGQFVSTPHKVQHKGNKARISLPFFVYPDIQSAFVPFGTDQEHSTKVYVKDVMLKNFTNIWVRGTGAGRALELA